MDKRKYTLYVLDQDNTFFKDCFHHYFETVKPFEEHFTKSELLKIYEFRKAKKKFVEKPLKSKAKKKGNIKGKPHKY